MFRTHLFHTVLEATKDRIEVYQGRESPFSPSPRENSHEPGPRPPPTTVNPQGHLAGDLREAPGRGLPGAEAAFCHLNASRLFRRSARLPSALHYLLPFSTGRPSWHITDWVPLGFPPSTTPKHLPHGKALRLSVPRPSSYRSLPKSCLSSGRSASPTSFWTLFLEAELGSLPVQTPSSLDAFPSRIMCQFWITIFSFSDLLFLMGKYSL